MDEENQLKIEGEIIKILFEKKGFILYLFVEDKTKKNYKVISKTSNLLKRKKYILFLNKYNKKYDSYEIYEISEPKYSRNEIKKILIFNIKNFGPAKAKKIEEFCGTNNWETILSSFTKNNYFIDILGKQIADSLKQFLEDSIGKYFLNNNLYFLFNELRKETDMSSFFDDIMKESIYNFYFKFSISPLKLLKLEDSLKLNQINYLDDFSLKNEVFILYYFDYFCERNNSTLIPYDLFKIASFISEFYHIENKDLEDKIADLLSKKKLIFSEDCLKITTESIRKKEQDILKNIYKIMQSYIFIENNHSSYELSSKQQQAFIKAIDYPVSIITGPPGTGKSYVVREIYNNFLNSNIKKNEIQILAPTGRAAANLIQKGLDNVRTIHSFLKIPKEEKFKNIGEINNDLKILIIDEFSMVNIDIFDFLLKKCPKIKKLVIIGDNNQIPCIGAGNILGDLIESKKIPFTELDEFYRTDNLDLINHFYKIKNNIFEISNSSRVNFYDFSKNDFYNNLYKIWTNNINKYGEDNVIFLAPTNELVNEINKKIQKYRIESIPNAISFDVLSNSEPLYLGDRVIQIINDYDLDVFNGEIGKVVEISDNLLIVDFEYKKIVYSKEIIKENLKLAYATTVHKFQGSETNCVNFLVFSDFSHMLKNKLIYTAISRAKEEINVIGNISLYASKIRDRKNNEVIYTSMQEILKKEKWWN
ncbi:ATP-dependent DNA helicase [Mycoplasmopsis meleagridis]|uniref:ATP-dependent DNA helicase n=1 Tax=Mycoplasmopsis meleagridis TaxID=29561 RepID=UPI00073D3EA9|nr:AAA family ATPase [Mycoplasmopsis meleagridis]KUH47604.1 hypothetical protein ASB56_00500 [Mycoplasmopsis meleagridis]